MTDVALVEPQDLTGPIIEAEPQPGSLPLRNPRHERYARFRAHLMPRAEAYRLAGFESEDHHAARGNGAKLERATKMIERIAYLSRQDEDVLRAKRERLEAFLWSVHETNYAEFFQLATRPVLDDEGEPIEDNDGNPVTYQFMDLKPFDQLSEDQQRMIQALNYTEKGRPKLELYSKMQANQELRKLLGIGVVTDEAIDETQRMTTPQIISELQKMGVDVKLSLEWKGKEAA